MRGHAKEPSRRIGLPAQEAVGAIALLIVPGLFIVTVGVWSWIKIFSS